MHQDLRESITKGIRMRPSRETDYPASVGILYLSPKHLVLAAAGDTVLGPVGVKFEAEWQVLWSDLDLFFIASVWALFPLQRAVSSVYLPHNFVLCQAHVSEGAMHVQNHCNEELV